jgi:hypothetical protein
MSTLGSRSEDGAAGRGTARSHATGLAEAPLRLTKTTAGHRRDHGLAVHRLTETATRIHRLSESPTAGVHRLPEPTAAGVHRLTKPTRSGLAGETEPAAASTALRGRRQIDERPLVVLVHPVIDLDRGVLALRGHALNAHRRLSTGGAAAKRARRGESASLAAARRRAESPTRGWGALLGGAEARGLCSGLLPWQPGLAGRHRAAHRDDLEVLVGNRIFVLLPQEPLLDQYVEVRGEGVGVPPLEQHDGAPILLASPDELFFAVAPGRLAPHRQRSRHHHRHHAQAHQQGGHRVPALGCVRALTR